MTMAQSSDENQAHDLVAHLARAFPDCLHAGPTPDAGTERLCNVLGDRLLIVSTIICNVCPYREETP